LRGTSRVTKSDVEPKQVMASVLPCNCSGRWISGCTKAACRGGWCLLPKEMVGAAGATKAKLFDNSIIDRLVQEGFIDKLYK